MISHSKILILAGGTGGHIIPALAVSNDLRSKGMEVVWLGTRKGLESELVPAAGIPLRYVTIEGVRGKGILSLLFAPYRLLKAVSQAMKIIRQENPDVVAGFGGFVSAPGGVAAWLMKKPLVIHEQNSVVGLTNQLLARLAIRVFQAFPNTFAEKFKPITCGNPVRPEICQLPTPEQRFQSREGKLKILVVGGSQGAGIFNELLPKILSQLPQPIQLEVWHSAGKNNVDAVQTRYVEAHISATVFPFIENMAAAYDSADLVICRAGALTIAELAAAGIGSLLIPYPHAVDDHQTQNAGWLVKSEAAYLIQQKDFNLEKGKVLLSHLLSDRDKLLKMAKAARSLALPNATHMVAQGCRTA